MHDPAQSVEKAGFVFKGRILAIEPAEMTDDEYAALLKEDGRREADLARNRIEDTVVLTFEVDSVWKGQVTERFVALYYSPMPMCEVVPFVDELYLVMGGVHKGGSNRVGALIHEDRIEGFERRLDNGS